MSNTTAMYNEYFNFLLYNIWLLEQWFRFKHIPCKIYDPHWCCNYEFQLVASQRIDATRPLKMKYRSTTRLLYECYELGIQHELFMCLYSYIYYKVKTTPMGYVNIKLLVKKKQFVSETKQDMTKNECTDLSRYNNIYVYVFVFVCMQEQNHSSLFQTYCPAGRWFNIKMPSYQ